MVFYLNTFKSHGYSVRLNLKGGTVFTRSRIGGFETMRQSRQRHPRQVGRSSKMYLALSLCLFSANLDHNNPLRPPTSTLPRKGTAVDAAIAALFCNGVSNPHSMGLGGGFLMTVYLANGTAVRSPLCREETLNYVYMMTS